MTSMTLQPSNISVQHGMRRREEREGTKVTKGNKDLKKKQNEWAGFDPVYER